MILIEQVTSCTLRGIPLKPLQKYAMSFNLPSENTKVLLPSRRRQRVIIFQILQSKHVTYFSEYTFARVLFVSCKTLSTEYYTRQCINSVLLLLLYIVTSYFQQASQTK